MRALRLNSLKSAALLLALALAVVGCDSEDVTGPAQQTVPPPTGQSGSSSNTTWNITVSTSANEVDINAGNALIQIEVTARRADNNQIVPPGTTALLTTTAGQLTSEAGTADSVPISFDVGGLARASLALNAGDLTNEGVVIVRAQIEGSFGTARITLLNVQQDAFQLLTVSPSTGPPSGGTLLTITGTGFNSPATGTITALGNTLQLEDVNVQSSTRMTARTPPINLPSGQNGVASITIENGPDQNGNATGTDTLGGAFTYTRSSAGATTLKLISISPTFGPNEGGTQVSIIGEGFGNSVQVYFTNGPLIEAQVLSITPNRLEVVTPSATGPNAPNANSIVDLRITDPVSGQQATLGGAFQYGRGGGGGLFISALSPGEDEYLGGTLVTIFGQGFEEPVAVSMGGTGQQIISVTGTEIVVRTVPVQINCANTGGAVSVTNIETNTGTTGPNFTYVPINPILVAVSPSRSNDLTDGNVTITGVPRSFGLGFDPPLRATIDGVVASQVSLSGDQIVVAVPPFTGTFPTEACTDALGETGTREIPVAVNVEVENLNTGCTDTLNNAFIYDPPNPECVVPLVANFTFTTEALGFQLNFVDQSTGGPTSWSWDFGDGNTSTLQNPSNLYLLGGVDYTVTLTVSKGGAPSVAQQTISIPQ